MQMKELKFFKCEICGNVTTNLEVGGGPLSCCAKPMAPLVANTKEASLEKHLPVYTIEDDILKAEVGSAIHPMSEEHYISFILVEFSDGSFAVHKLLVVNEPVAYFPIKGKDPVAVYEYCNLHGLWVTKIDK